MQRCTLLNHAAAMLIQVSPDDTGPIDVLFNCMLDIETWMAANFSTAEPGQNRSFTDWSSRPERETFTKVKGF